jgi:ribosomal protein S18 acetylase RimI-like enzyme
VTITIEVPKTDREFGEFVRFFDRVYEQRSARWMSNAILQLPLLEGKSPFLVDREIRPFVAREDGKMVARALAVVDGRYIRKWNEKIGHIIFFEALPGTRDAVRLLLDEACAWLAERGMIAARTGMGMLDFPYVIDAYEKLPPSIMRQNPDYYHALIKEAGFETEKGFVDYKIKVTPELVKRWENALEGARRAGLAIVPLREIAEAKRAPLFAELWNETFTNHWGFTPFIPEEVAFFFTLLDMAGVHETSVVAYDGDDPVGMLFVARDLPEFAALAPGRELADDEKMNMLGIGVREKARGRGVNYAMASHAFLHLVRGGAKYVSYTLVLDDNWPSRRTGMGLGGDLCANYLAYRRNLRR